MESIEAAKSFGGQLKFSEVRILFDTMLFKPPLLRVTSKSDGVFCHHMLYSKGEGENYYLTPNALFFDDLLHGLYSKPEL